MLPCFVILIRFGWRMSAIRVSGVRGYGTEACLKVLRWCDKGQELCAAKTPLRKDTASTGVCTKSYSPEYCLVRQSSQPEKRSRMSYPGSHCYMICILDTSKSAFVPTPTRLIPRARTLACWQRTSTARLEPKLPKPECSGLANCRLRRWSAADDTPKRSSFGIHQALEKARARAPCHQLLMEPAWKGYSSELSR